MLIYLEGYRKYNLTRAPVWVLDFHALVCVGGV